MSRKNMLLTLIIVVMFGGAAFVLYKGFFAKKSTADIPNQPITVQTNSTSPVPPPSSTTSTPGAPASTVVSSLDSSKILPLGTSFDFSLVKKFNVGPHTVYPIVDPLEVGAGLNDLVKVSN